MGTWSHKILGNDTSCEVRERFIELYNNDQETSQITQLVINEQKGNIECDPTNVWFGLALICWECKCLTTELLKRVKTIVQSGEDIAFNIELQADEEFIEKRKIELEKFIEKISTPKIKPRRRVKPPREYDFQIKQGEIYEVKVNSDLNIKILIVHSKHYKNKGEIRYINLLDGINKEMENLIIPSSYYWPQNRKWSEYINGGSSYSFEYNKSDKDAFLKQLDSFSKVGNLPNLNFNRLTFSIRWDNIDLASESSFSKLMLKRWKEDTDINYRATTVKELIEHLEMKPTHNNR
jgi:hypothetical protein